MIQQISPKHFYNQFELRDAESQDFVIVLKEKKIAMIRKAGSLDYPRVCDLPERSGLVYLFRIDEEAYFLAETAMNCEAWEWLPYSCFRTLKPNDKALAGITAVQLAQWRESRTYCGCCGNRMHDSLTERARVCGQCGRIEYPVISPCIITAVIDRKQDKLLVVHGHQSRVRMALVAGYVEIGESLEQAVKREVQEEVGLQVKNIRYAGSQPWAFTSVQMMGFVSELEGSAQLTLQETEIHSAEWLTRQEIPENPDPLSIGHQMIEQFRQGLL